MSKNIAIIGGGGLAKEVIEVAQMLGHSIHGIFAQQSQIKTHEHKGYLDELLAQKQAFDGAIIAFGAVNADSITARRQVMNFLNKNNIPQVSLISPLATISDSATIKKGCYIAHHVLVSCDVIIGENVCLNYYATIGHDVHIGHNVSIAPQAFIGGNVHIADNVMIGASACIKQGVTISSNALVGLGAVVNQPLDSYQIALAQLARISN